jgi:hypothetical protein
MRIMSITTQHAIELAAATEQTRRIANQPTYWVEVSGLTEYSGVTNAQLAPDPWSSYEALVARTTVAINAARALGVSHEAVDPLSMYPGRHSDTLIISVTAAGLDAAIPPNSGPVRQLALVTRDRSGQRGPFNDIVAWEPTTLDAKSPAKELTVSRMLVSSLRSIAAEDDGLSL